MAAAGVAATTMAVGRVSIMVVVRASITVVDKVSTIMVAGSGMISSLRGGLSRIDPLGGDQGVNYYNALNRGDL